MAARAMLIYAAIAVLGIVLLAVGWSIQANSNVARAGTAGTLQGDASNPTGAIQDNAGVALIAFGLTLLLVGLGFFFAWASERALAEGMM